MKSELERYVEKIVNRTECSKEEKQDMFEEMMVHLELSMDELKKEGMSEKEAEQLVMLRFGNEDAIGDHLQQSIFPYRKEFMLTLAIVSFLFTVSVYLLALFTEGDAHIVWLSCSMAVNTLLLMLSLNVIQLFNRRRWMNSLLIIHILTYLYGYGIVSMLLHPAQLPLSILGWLIILLGLLLVYQTTIYSIDVQEKIVKQAKRLHQLNFFLGVFATGTLIFFMCSWGMLFSGFHPLMLLAAIPFSVWVILYALQMRLLKGWKRIAFVLAALSISLNITTLVWLLFPTLYR